MLSDFDELNKDQASSPWNVAEMYDSVDEQYDTWKLSLKAGALDKHMHGKKMSERQGHTIYDRGMERGDQEQEKACTSVYSQPHAENWALKATSY